MNRKSSLFSECWFSGISGLEGLCKNALKLGILGTVLQGGGSVTKSELIEEVARQAPDISKRDVEIIVNTIFDSMTAALARHDRIEIRGFGSFVAKPRRAREGRNPRTGEKVQVPQKWVPFFTVGKELRKRINQKPEAVAEVAPAPAAPANGNAGQPLRAQPRPAESNGTQPSMPRPIKVDATRFGVFSEG